MARSRLTYRGTRRNACRQMGIHRWREGHFYLHPWSFKKTGIYNMGSVPWERVKKVVETLKPERVDVTN